MIDIFSGFLGAGKTMLIKKLINEKLHSDNIVIIENEFGEVGIDGSILKRTNIEVKEINAGCICCSISGDFKKAIKEVIEKYRPERIIIEPSGVGKLSEILNSINSEDMRSSVKLNMIITLVDVLKYEMYITNFGEFYRNQIINAKTIILSRTQKIAMDRLEKITAAIRNLNQNANIITTPWDRLNANTIVEVAENDAKFDINEKVNLLKKPARNLNFRIAKNHHADQIFNTWGVETPKIFSEVILKNIFSRLEDSEQYGTVLRAKGIVQVSDNKWVQFDYVPEEFQVKDTSPDYTGRICVIGSDLKKDELMSLFSI
ncbi:CobW family GTP-binding protein [Clostridium sp. WILCCON 0269]|uniref:CobW family GTP-binding protein n=1 Tax=Candidatus Clostridium eludens TaxID=3381663 RepID=A0ABW8SMC0_9CLOT